MMKVTLTQHPVGQGGMMSGLLTTTGGQFHWAYDCGSNQADALNREIAMVVERGAIDCLFLSHLDSDHVNGIDRLLTATSVKEVVLPYLNDLDRLIAAAHDAASGTLTGGFLTFLGDIEGWFGARGVERVTFINPRDDDGEGGEDRPMLPRSDGGGDGRIHFKWKPSELDDHNSHFQEGVPGETPLVQRFETAAALHLTASTGELDWVLLPYAHRPSDATLQAFRRKIERQFAPNFRPLLQQLLRDEKLRKKVKECYDLIWSDHNRVSMTVYAGPCDSSNWDGLCPSYHHWWPEFEHGGAVGWLGTGDMHLSGSRRRQAMLNHYGDILDQVNVLGLPHHGSNRNFHASLLTSMPNVTHCVAAAGPNGYGHPSDAVKQAVQTAGREFLHVSDQGQSVLRWKHSR